jgi:hypothetical protein
MLVFHLAGIKCLKRLLKLQKEKLNTADAAGNVVETVVEIAGGALEAVGDVAFSIFD